MTQQKANSDLCQILKTLGFDPRKYRKLVAIQKGSKLTKINLGEKND